MALVDNIAHYWKMDEASGNMIDAHGSNDGTCSGITYGTTGIINDCYTFGGDGDHVTLGTEITMDESCSISLWFYSDATQKIICGKDDTNNYLLHGSTSLIRLQNNNDEDQNFAFPGTVTTGAWHHLVITKDSSSNWRCYLDNVESTTGAINSVDPFQIDTIGDAYSGTTIYSWAGELDEIGYWTKQLTTQEISDLYNSGSGFAYPFSASGTNFQMNIGDAWKEISALQINIGDVWKEIAGVQVNIGDSWREVF